jgi:hypothetical protein
MTLAVEDAPVDVPTIVECCRDQDLFGQWFRRPQTWGAWLAFLAVLFGLPVTPEQAALVEQCTGRSELPSTQFVEAWLCCGRRAGKSFVLALVAVYLACFGSYAQYLGPNEKATLAIIATDRRQARAIYRFAASRLVTSAASWAMTARPLQITSGDMRGAGVRAVFSGALGVRRKHR